MTSSAFKGGDHVRFTYEGVLPPEYNPDYDDVLAFVGGLYIEYAGGKLSEHLEKLTPPEPEWVQGDVIRIDGYGAKPHILVRGDDTWNCNCVGPVGEPNNFVSSWWESDGVTVIYKDGKVVK